MMDDATLVVDELVGNAVLHGRPLPDGAIQVDWECSTGGVRISITDGGGPTRPVVRRRSGAGSLLPSGRGLGIVAELSSQWGVTVDDDRATVWAVVESDSR